MAGGCPAPGGAPSVCTQLQGMKRGREVPVGPAVPGLGTASLPPSTQRPQSLSLRAAHPALVGTAAGTGEKLGQKGQKPPVLLRPCLQSSSEEAEHCQEPGRGCESRSLGQQPNAGHQASLADTALAGTGSCTWPSPRSCQNPCQVSHHVLACLWCSSTQSSSCSK